MKPEVEKLVFTEFETEEDSPLTSFIAESPMMTYYIDFDKSEGAYRSYCTTSEIGEDRTLIKAIQRVNAFHSDNVLKCLVCQ